MANISRIKLDETTYEIKDAQAARASDLATKQDALTAGDGIAIDSNDIIRTTGIPFGVVDSTSTSTAYTVTVPGIYKLEEGVCCLVRNGKVTSESGFTLNVNGLGAKPSYSNMATGNTHTPTAPTRDTTIFNINYTMLFIYTTSLPDVPNGAWICYRGYDANTNTIGYQVRSNSHSLPASQKFYRYRLLFTSADGTHYVPANTSSSTNATASRTVNQTPIDPFGHIVYYGTTAAVEANARPAASSLWVIYTLSLGYSFNKTGAALTLDDWAPVYLKCAPQANGSAIIDETTPYVQSLPTTADGKIYIFLGVAYSATNIELLNNHPVYYHDGTGIRIWTGKTIPSKTSELTNDSGFQTKQQTLLYINTVPQNESFELEELPTFYDTSNNVVSASQVKALFDDPSKDVVLAVKSTDNLFYNLYRMVQKSVGDPDYIFHSLLADYPSQQRTLLFQLYEGEDWTWSSYILDISLMIQDIVPTKVSDLTNDSGFITSSSLNGYATESYVDNKVPFIANVTISTNPSTGTVTASSITTHAQIKEAVAAGRSVYVKTSIGTVLHLMHINNDEAHFSIVGESSGWMMQQISCTSSNVWSVVNSGLATVATSGSYNDLTNKPTLLTTQKTILYASGTTRNLSFTNSSNASLVRDQVVDLLNNVGNDILLFLTNPIDSVTYPYIFTEKVSDTRWKLQLLSDTKYGHVTLDSGRGNNIIAWENVLNTIPTVDSSLTGSSQTNPVQGGAIYSALEGKVPTFRKINNKPLSSDITLTASDIGADVFVVTITSSTNNGTTTYSANKTNAQIVSAWQEGRYVVCTDGDIVWNLVCVPTSSYAVFGSDNYDDYQRLELLYIQTSNNTQTVTLQASYYQSELVSGTNIKTVNNQSLLGSGNITPAQLGVPNQIKVGSVAGKLYRNDVNGGGNFTVKGNSGCIPNLTAGTFLVSVYAKSSTQSYSFRFNFGSVTYDLSTTNGEINDVRQITIPSNGTFSGSVLNGSVAPGTILYVVMYDYLTPVSTVGIAAVTNRHSDLDGIPNGTLTIQKNGTTVGTFTANQSSNTTANITVPTTASDVGAMSTSHPANAITSAKITEWDGKMSTDYVAIKMTENNGTLSFKNYETDATLTHTQVRTLLNDKTKNFSLHFKYSRNGSDVSTYGNIQLDRQEDYWHFEHIDDYEYAMCSLGWDSTNNEIYIDELIGSYFADLFQERLVSGTNIKTINNQSLLGSGNLTASDVGAEDRQKVVVKITNISVNNVPTFVDANNNALTHAQVKDLLDNLLKDVIIYWTSNNLFYSLYYAESGDDEYYFSALSADDSYVYWINLTWDSSNNTFDFDNGNYTMQQLLVSGTNIKTINNQSLLGSGNLTPAQLGVPSIANNLTTTTAGSALDATQGKALKDIVDTKADPVPIVTVSTTGAVTQALDPNKFYNFTGSPTSLTLTLNSGNDLCIYAGKFTAGTGFSNLTFPSTVKVADGAPSVEAGGVYEFSVMNNLLLLAKEGS